MRPIAKFAVIASHAVVGWALCGAIMAIGQQLTTLDRTLILHAIGAPVFFGLISWLYHRKFAFTSPATTAVVFLLVVLALDLGVVALLIERSFAMFKSPLGTWLPLASIFVATYVTGRVVEARRRAA